MLGPTNWQYLEVLFVVVCFGLAIFWHFQLMEACCTIFVKKLLHCGLSRIALEPHDLFLMDYSSGVGRILFWAKVSGHPTPSLRHFPSTTTTVTLSWFSK